MKIAIADRHHERRQALEEVLVEAGHAVLAVPGVEALENALGHWQPQLVLAALAPGEAEELTARLRPEGLPPVPLLLYCEEFPCGVDHAALSELDAAHLLHPPATPDRLLAAVEALVRAPEAELPRELLALRERVESLEAEETLYRKLIDNAYDAIFLMEGER